MTIKEIKDLLKAEVLYGEDKLDRVIDSAFAADLMSDVLAFVEERTALITGLVNIHVFRTAQMTDVSLVIFSRGKKPNTELLEMGKSLKVIMLSTNYTSYETSGILYSNGLPGITNDW